MGRQLWQHTLVHSGFIDPSDTDSDRNSNGYYYAHGDAHQYSDALTYTDGNANKGHVSNYACRGVPRASF